MIAASADRIERHLQRAARLGTYLTALIAVVALIGWLAGLPSLPRVRPGLAATSVATAICFLLGAFAVHRLTILPPRRFGRDWPQRVSAAIIVLIGLYALAEYLAGVAHAGFLLGPDLGAVSPATAANFVLLGAAVLVADLGDGIVGVGFTTLGLVITEIDLIGYAYGVDALYRVMPFTAMGLLTALAFAIIYAALLMARPGRGWIKYAAQDDRVGAAFRVLMPAVIIVPFALGSLMLGAVSLRWFEFPFAFAIFVVVTTVLLGGMVGFVAAWTSRSDAARRQAESQLIQAQKMEAIGNLTGGMAHDFNNLLSIIIGNLDMARASETLGEDDMALIGDAIEAALRGAELTRRLLAFARRQPLSPQRVDVNALIEDFVKLLRRTLGETIAISLDLADDLWPVVADPVQIEASLANLATNAKDAMPGGGTLSIVTMNRPLDADYTARFPGLMPGDYAMIEVSDTGTGMTADTAARIFEPFFTTKPQGRGTGLGLSMVFGFVKQSGGHINVYTEPGVGTTFRLYLPRVMGQGEAPEPIERDPLARSRGEIVLAVEDNASLRRVVMRQLKGLGYAVIEAENAAAALELLAREKVDIVFTDVIMAGELDGYGLARKVREQWPAVKIVLTSGFPQARPDSAARHDTSFVLLSKPYRRSELARVLRDALDR
jgi:signal transduction histidine kinase/CheY-like chemotaxis protein